MTPPVCAIYHCDRLATEIVTIKYRSIVRRQPKLVETDLRLCSECAAKVHPSLKVSTDGAGA